MNTLRLGVASVLASLLAGATAAWAEQPASCPKWFPDLQCERAGRYEGFIAPMSAPYLFEEPFIVTGVSVWGLWHEFPEKSVFQGGDARVFAVQARLAITDRLALIATKDGWIEIRPDLNLLDTESGLGDLMLGVKYALIDSVDKQFILTSSLRYELTQGSRDVFQGNGEGVFLPALSLAKGFGDTHILAGVGVALPVDGDAESTQLFYNFHIDYALSSRLTPFLEINGYHYLDDGDGTTPVKLGNGVRLPISTVQAALNLKGFEALDVANLGSDDVEGNDIITAAIGLRIRINGRSSLGIAYERPLTRRKDILKQRVTLNVTWEF